MTMPKQKTLSYFVFVLSLLTVGCPSVHTSGSVDSTGKSSLDSTGQTALSTDQDNTTDSHDAGKSDENPGDRAVDTSANSNDEGDSATKSLGNNTVFKLSKDHMLQIEMQVIGASAEMYLNGIPIQHKSIKGSHLFSVPALLYLVDNINTIELVIGTGPIPSQARTGPNTDGSKPQSAFVRLVEYPMGVYPGDERGKIIMEARLQDPNVKLPHAIKARADLGRLFGPRKWQTAETLKLDTNLTLELTNFVKKAYRAYKNGNTKYLKSITKIFFEEGAQSYHHLTGETASDNLSGFVDDLKQKVKEKFWRFSGLDPDQFDFRIVADGKMIDCIDKKWQPIVKSDEIDHDFYDFSMMVSKINGKWEVVH